MWEWFQAWLIGPWPMLTSSFLWFMQAIGYASRKDWGHTLMAVCYGLATIGLVWSWFDLQKHINNN